MTETGPATTNASSAHDSLLLATLEQKIGHTFQDIGLLERALTHSSAVNNRQHSNERLEFLGDRVLGLVVADMLLGEFPDEDEGALGYRFAALARRESLERVAHKLQLEPYIRREMDPVEISGRQRSGLLANACEALIAALYLDGGLPAAAGFIRKHWIELLREDLRPPKDSKTRLQEYAQGKGWPLPEYRIIEQSGPDHAPKFIVEVSIHNNRPVHGSGRSKRSAETQAAESLFSQLTGNSENG
jgi:ribonuclease III